MAQETETKLELSPASFQRLLASSTLLHRVEQLNVYYDCANAITQRSGSLRIRFIHGAAPVMTLKLPIERSAGRRVSTEIEEPFGRWLPPKELEIADVAAAFQPYLHQLCRVPLRRLGSMRNRRSTVRLPSGETIELDRVTLPGGELFHEAEIESDDMAVHAAAVAAVQRAAPDCRFSGRGKFQRFREALGRMRS